MRCAQHRRDVGDARADALAIPGQPTLTVGGEHANDPTAKPARVRDIFLNVSQLGVEQHSMHIDQHGTAIQRVDAGEAGHRIHRFAARARRRRPPRRPAARRCRQRAPRRAACLRERRPLPARSRAKALTDCLKFAGSLSKVGPTAGHCWTRVLGLPRVAEDVLQMRDDVPGLTAWRSIVPAPPVKGPPLLKKPSFENRRTSSTA